MPKEFVKKYIDLLALHKLNRFHWHLTDDQGWRIEIKKYPLLTSIGGWRRQSLVGQQHAYADTTQWVYDKIPHGGFYTQDDVREIVAYAQARFVTVVPEIEMPGHAQAAIAAYPWLGNTGQQLEVLTHWGVDQNILNPSDSAIHFMQDVLTEVLALFPSHWIHTGGDEAPKPQWVASPVAQARIRELGLHSENELQSWMTAQMSRFLEARGRALIGWDEILEGGTEGLAPNAVVMSWRGMDGGIAAAQAGHDVVMTPTSNTYFDYYQSQNTANEPLAIGGFLPLETVYAFEPVPASFDSAQASHVLGTQGQIWTEYQRTPKNVEYMVFPRLTALAEVAWTPRDQRNFADFSAHCSSTCAAERARRELPTTGAPGPQLVHPDVVDQHRCRKDRVRGWVVIEIPADGQIENHEKLLIEHQIAVLQDVHFRHDVMLGAVDEVADRLAVPLDGVDVIISRGAGRVGVSKRRVA
jgi:hexosaminidase